MIIAEFQRQKVPLKKLPANITEKWSMDTLEEGFVPLPKMLLRCMSSLFSGPTAIVDLTALLAVIDYRRPKLTRPPSRKYLAFVAGQTVDEFSAALERLNERGYIRVESSEEGLDIEINGILQAIKAATQDSTET